MEYTNILDNMVWKKKRDAALLSRCAETPATKEEHCLTIEILATATCS